MEDMASNSKSRQRHSGSLSTIFLVGETMTVATGRGQRCVAIELVSVHSLKWSVPGYGIDSDMSPRHTDGHRAGFFFSRRFPPAKFDDLD